MVTKLVHRVISRRHNVGFKRVCTGILFQYILLVELGNNLLDFLFADTQLSLQVFGESCNMPPALPS